MKIKGLLIFLVSISILTSCANSGTSSSSSSSSNNSITSSNSSKNNEHFQYNGIDSIWNFKQPKAGDIEAVIKTTMGDIKLVLFKEVAPKAVENFVTHSKNGYYNGVIFHRVIKDFMIQTGDPKGNGTGGESIWKAGFENETASTALHFRGALSMANASLPNSNGSQFFIVQANKVSDSNIASMKSANVPNEIIEKYKEVGGTPWLDGAHTVFGRVVEGMDTVDKIANVATGTQNGVQDFPLESIKINIIEIKELS